MLQAMNATHLYALFQYSLHSDANQRMAAEVELKKMSEAAGFLPVLLQLIADPQFDSGIRKAAMVYGKNLIRLKWENINDQDRAFVHGHVLKLIVTLEPSIRSLLAVSLNAVLSEDFPEKWPTFLDQVKVLLSSANMKEVTAGLLGMKELVKVYRFKRAESRIILGKIVRETFPALLNIGKQLISEPFTNAAAGFMLKTIVKTYHDAVDTEMPKSLMEDENMVQWCTMMVACINVPVPREFWGEEHVDYAWWKAKKWAYRSLYRVFSRYGNPALESFREANYKKFASRFMEKYATALFGALLSQIENFAKGEWLPDKIVATLLSFMTDGLKHKVTWKLVKPIVEPLVSHLIFPILCFSETDKEQWEDDPVEYIQKKFDPIEEYQSTVACAADLLSSLMTDRPKHSFAVIMHFINQVLTTDAVPEHIDGALVMLSVLAEQLISSKVAVEVKGQIPQVLGQFVLPHMFSQHDFLKARACAVLRKFCDVDSNEEIDLSQVIFPNNPSIVGWMAVFHGALGLMALNEPLPVRVYAALAVESLVEHSQVKANAGAHIATIMELFLKLSNEIDLDHLASAMERFVEMFPEEVAPFALQLCIQLRDTFMRVMEEVPTDDLMYESTDKILMSMGIIKTLCTLILSVQIPDEKEQQAAKKQPAVNKEQQMLLLAQLEEAVLPCAAFVIEKEMVDLQDDIFELMQCCAYQQKRISEAMWRLFEPLCKLAKGEAIDYMDEIFPVLDNYISYGKEVFMTNANALSLVLGIVDAVLHKEHLSLSDRTIGMKLIESLLLNCRTGLDQFLPSFVQYGIEQLKALTPKTSTSYFVHVVEVVLNCVYYSPSVTVNLMNQAHCTQQFFELLNTQSSKFSRVHDKKLIIAAMNSVLAQCGNDAALASSLNTAYRPIMAALVHAFITLPKAIETREEMLKMEEKSETDEDESFEQEDSFLESDEEEWAAQASSSFVDDHEEPIDEEAEYLEYLQKKAAHGAAEDDEDDEDWADELGEELYFETPLDDLNVYTQFGQVMKDLPNKNPAVYQALQNGLTPDETTAIQSVLEVAFNSLNK